MNTHVSRSVRQRALLIAAVASAVALSSAGQAQQYQAPPTYAEPVATNQPQAVLPQNAGAVAVNGQPVAPAPLSPKDSALKEFRLQAPVDMPVIVTQAQWTPAIEDQFSAFVAKFGAGVRARPMRTVKSYMRDPNTNMYAGTDPKGVIFYSDCADLPYFLRSYFAYKNGLPMAIASDAVMNMHPYASTGSAGYDTWSMNNSTRTDVSPYGNTLTHRGGSNIPSAPGREKNYIQYWAFLMDTGSTRTFMVSPFTPNYGLSDVYPVKIDRSGIRPGTLIHSDGHMMVVTAVKANGTVELIDAHPDNSVQFHSVSSDKLKRDRPDLAYGFYRFRPAQAVGGQWLTAPNGQRALYGAKIVTESDQQLFSEGKWSVEQWMGSGSTIAPGQAVDPNLWQQAYGSGPKTVTDAAFFKFLRSRLATTDESADDAAGDILEAFCDDTKQRVADVERAVADGHTREAHPATLPQDIYNADPAWEADATPSRDGRTRQAIINMPNAIAEIYKQGIQHQNKLTYAGTAAQFQASVLAKIAQLDVSCKAIYKNSADAEVAMNFSSLIRRAPRMSLDMNDCAEKRWGAVGPELATCRDQDPTGRWYAAEQSIRNFGGKTNAAGAFLVRSDRPITLEMLESDKFTDQPDSAPISLGLSHSNQPNVKAYLASPQFLQDLSR